MRYGEAGQSHLLPFLGAAALFAALTITAHSLVLGLAAVIAGPVPAAQTALSLSRKAVSGAAQEEAASVAEAAPESTGTAASQPEAAAPTGGIESYLVELLGDDARPEGAGAVIEKNYPQGSGEKYVACGAGSIKNNTRQTAADIAAEIQEPLPFGVEKDSPDPQILIMHTHATEDYRLSAGLWYSPGDGARTTDTNLNMCAVGRVMADTLNAAGLNTLHDETLNDYPSYTGSYENSRAVVQRYLAQYPSIKVVLDVHRDAIETEGGSRMAPVCTVDGRQAAQVMIICGCDNGGSVRLPGWRQNLRFAAAWERSMEGMYPGFTRPVLFSYRFYNQDLTTGSLLIEIGGHGNNLNEAQYGPARLAPKYRFDPQNELLNHVQAIPELKTERLTLSALTEADIPAYNALVLDADRNRWWGYDDVGGLGGRVEERSFFDVAKRDFENRQAVNFAVRLDGKLIGEAVLYRFDCRGGAELGCRIDKAYAGNGYGTEAFAAVAEWGLYKIHLSRVVAKCYKENQASYKMLSACMRKKGEDDTFFYFEKLV